eukprot:gene7881-8077_t
MDVPLLEDEEIRQTSAAPADIESGLTGELAGSEADASNKTEEDRQIEEAARASYQSGAAVYCVDIFRLAIFYWAIVADALLLKELYGNQYLVLAGIATGFTVGPHVFMSLLLIIRQGWLQAASQACGFILTLNPFENLTPIPQGILGLFVLSIGFIAYVLIAASGLIFVAYCVICYLVTALLFSLLILDLAALVISVAPSKAIFKYTDLVYTENFKFSRLVLQSWLQSLPELVVIGVILYRDIFPAGPAVVINGPILLQALLAHTINVWDKALLFRSAATFSNAGAVGQLLAVLAVKGSCRLSLPVLKENLGKVLRGVGGTEGAGLGSVVHISSYEEVPDSSDSDAAASMVPEYLTPTNGGMLSPGQLMALVRVVFGRQADSAAVQLARAVVRHGGPGVAELMLEITPDVVVGKLLLEAVPSVPNISSVRLVNAAVRGRDGANLAAALLQCRSLRTLQLHQSFINEAGAMGLVRLLEHTPTLQQLDLCRCKLGRKAPRALAQGLRCNKTLRQLNLAGCKGLDEAGAGAIAAAVASSKVLTALNLAFVKLSSGAVDCLVQAVDTSSSLRVLAVSQKELPVEGAKRLLSAVSKLRCPKAAPSLSCGLTVGTFPVDGLDKVQWLAVQDQDALIMDAWQNLAEDAAALTDGWWAGSGGGAAAALVPTGTLGLGPAAGAVDARGVGGGLEVAEDDVIDSVVRAPLLFEEMDSLDLSGLVMGDDGAAAMGKVLQQNPALRRCVLADNKIGEAGAAALAEALAVNTTLQLVLLGNKIPFGLATLRRLMEAEASNPQCHLVLVEEPTDVLEQLDKAGDDTCGICFDNSNHVAIKYCGHMLCVDCYRRMWELNGSASSCPFCRAHLDGYAYLAWPLEG